MDSPFTIRVVDDVEGMGALEDAWNALAPPDCKPPFTLAALPALRTDAMRALKMRFSRGVKSMGVYLPGFQEGVEVFEILRFVPL